MNSLERIRADNIYSQKPMSAGVNTRINKSGRNRTIRELLSGAGGRPTGGGGGLDAIESGGLQIGGVLSKGPLSNTNASTENCNSRAIMNA